MPMPRAFPLGRMRWAKLVWVAGTQTSQSAWPKVRWGPINFIGTANAQAVTKRGGHMAHGF